jgi:succinate dehydrogenase/fumarate reductase flavoprotein subunit
LQYSKQKRTLFATGGAGRIYAVHLPMPLLTRVMVLGMAARAGIPLQDMEFGNFTQQVLQVRAYC